MNILVLFLILIFIFLGNDFYKKNKRVNNKNVKLPRGPLALPIIGNIPQIKCKEILFNEQEHSVVEKYSRQYDGIVRIYLGDRYFLFVSNYEIVKYLQKDENFMDRPSLFVPGWKYISMNGSGIMGSNDETWSTSKSIVAKSLRIHSTKELFEKKSIEFVDLLKIYADSNETFYPKAYIQGYACSMLFKYMFNQDFNVKNQQAKTIGNAVEHVFGNISKLTAFDCFEFLSPFYDWFFTERLKGCDIVRHIISNHNDKHLASIDPNNPRDLMDDLILGYGVDEITPEIKTQINQTCFDIFGPAIGTITITLNWVLLQLCNRPELQEIAYNEVKNAVKGNDIEGANSNYVNLSHKQSAPYVVAFIKETMRLCSNGFGLPKTAKSDQVCANYLIQKDSVIFVNYLAISLNEDLYRNASEFNPLRYLDESLPIPQLHFGVGPRACPGRFIAIDKMFLAVSNILLKYKIKSVDGKKIDDSIQFSVSLKAKDYGLKLEKRT